MFNVLLVATKDFCSMTEVRQNSADMAATDILRRQFSEMTEREAERQAEGRYKRRHVSGKYGLDAYCILACTVIVYVKLK